MRKIRLGSGAGYSGDRLEPALDLIEHGNIDYIGFECLAERTIALAHEQMLRNPEKGYNEFLEYRMNGILPLFDRKQFKVITNMGAANPRAAVRVVAEMAAKRTKRRLKIAAVYGDDILDTIDTYRDYIIMETGEKLGSLGNSIISANAYIGAEAIVEALKGGADIVIGGRIADPALFLGPLMYEFGWKPTDSEKVGKGILVGHLLECSSQVMGGYFADPGFKDVPELWNIGFPIAEVDESGDAVITKLPSAGGMVTPATVKEQIIYEIHDPRAYFTPDGVADYSQVGVEEIGKDKVAVRGASGKPSNGMYKVSVGYKDGFIGEGEISYGGPGAYERAELAGKIITERLKYRKVPVEEIRVDYIGVNSLYKEPLSLRLNANERNNAEVRLRVAIRTKTKEDAELVGNEVETLYLNGPAGGGGAWKNVKEVIAVASILIPRKDISVGVEYQEV
ncbi:MAG: acyclic terpene utilization AtuA family protein [Treponemataceae bacterium]